MKLIFQKLVFDWLKKNKKLMVGYILVVIFTFPVETVLLPKFYSRLFEVVRKNIVPISSVTSSNIGPSILNADSVGTLATIMIIWIAVIIGYGIKNSMQSEILPEYLSHIRKVIIQHTITNHSDNFQDIRIGKHITRILDIS